jgi:hypothetical protein
MVPWTVVSDPQSFETFASRLAAAPTMGSGGSGTSVSGGLLFAASQFRSSGVESYRKTIDVSGDGVSDEGPPMDWARDLVVGQRSTINGLSLGKQDGNKYGSYLTPIGSERDVHAYYKESVIGGPGAFAIAVKDFDDFALAIRKKLILEIAWRPSRFASLELERQ